MRVSAIVVVSLAALPLCLEAQEFPTRTRRPRPSIPAELPPQAPVVGKHLAYKRVRTSIESYPLFSVVHAPLLQGTDGRSFWTTIGAGSHIGYRVSHLLQGTLDITASEWGGPVRTETAELGARIMPDRYESRTRPFADVRVGYMRATGHGFARDDGFGGPSSLPFASYGFGGIVGAGVHHDLSASFSLLTSASLMRGQLSSDGPVAESRSVPLTSFRLSVGLRYNRVRQILTSDPNAH